MSYIVCRNCKKFFKVDEKQPLNFDKCENCGHTLEFASNDSELKIILNDIVVPEISHNKICLSCNSTNPRETGACLYCGSTNLHLQYDLESFQNQQGMIHDISSQPNTRTIIIQAGSGFSPKNSIIFRLFSLFIGLIDFFFFSLIGIQVVLGGSDLPADLMAFATEHMYPLMAVISVSLVLAGIMSVMIIPRMSYKDSIETSSTIGIVVGLITLLASRDIMTVIVSVIFCMVLAGIGGLIGEFIIHKLTRRIKP